METSDYALIQRIAKEMIKSSDLHDQISGPDDLQYLSYYLGLANFFITDT